MMSLSLTKQSYYLALAFVLMLCMTHVTAGMYD